MLRSSAPDLNEERYKESGGRLCAARGDGRSCEAVSPQPSSKRCRGADKERFVEFPKCSPGGELQAVPKQWGCCGARPNLKEERRKEIIWGGSHGSSCFQSLFRGHIREVLTVTAD